jgi:cation transport ATPase
MGTVLDETEYRSLSEGLQRQGKTTVSVAYDGRWVGIIGIADSLREDSARAIHQLKKMGITPVMITGDHKTVAMSVAKSCGIEEKHVFARALPADKEKILREYAAKGSVAMVGDGINDAPALSAADVGIAIGAGTEVAIDCADVVLSRSSLSDAVSAVDLSRATMRCIKENLFWALIYNAICIPVAAGALYPAFGIALSPMIGSAAMSLSSVCVVLNSLRLRRISVFGEKKTNKKQQKMTKNQSKKEQKEMFGKTKTVTFGVEGMMCKNCKAHVEKALNETKGVKSAVADLETKSVCVVVKESVSEETLKEAVVAAGYKVNEVK